jgi:hypothetical protein
MHVTAKSMANHHYVKACTSWLVPTNYFGLNLDHIQSTLKT